MLVDRTIMDMGVVNELFPDPSSRFKKLRQDLIEAIKFDLGRELTDTLAGSVNQDLPVPSLPFDKAYFEIESIDKRRYAALFINDNKIGVCGELFVETPSGGALPIGISFREVGARIKLDRKLNEHCAPHIPDFREEQKLASFALRLVIKAIEVISCSNVELKDHNKMTPRLMAKNKKRAKKGKAQLYSYKTLHLKIGDDRKANTPQGGTHSSPRVHLRRGHIRKLSGGRKIWVQACVVGDKKKGVVHKDYSIKVVA